MASPRARDDVSAQARDLHCDVVVGGERRGLVEQLDCTLAAPGDPGVRRGVEQPAPANVDGGAEPRRALGRQRGRRVGAALSRSLRRVRKCAGGGVVRPERCLAEMPGSLVRQAGVAHRRGERAVSGAALGGLRRVVHGGADERMAELDAAVRDDHETGGLGLLERRDLDAERRCRLGEQAELGVRGRGRDEQRAPCHLGQPRDATREGALDGGRDREGPFDQARGHALGLACELDQRERIAPGRPEQPLRAACGHRVVPLVREQRLGGAEVETGQCELGQIGAGERRGLARAHADDDRDGVGEQPARGEQDRLGRRLVEPVRVVHEHAHRPLLGSRRRGPRASRRRSRGARRRRPGRARAPHAARRPEGVAGARRARARGAAARAGRRTGSTPRARCRGPTARACRLAADAAWPSRALLPMPASPLTIRTPLVPTRASASRRSIAARSDSRPSSMARV